MIATAVPCFLYLPYAILCRAARKVLWLSICQYSWCNISGGKKFSKRSLQVYSCNWKESKSVFPVCPLWFSSRYFSLFFVWLKHNPVKQITGKSSMTLNFSFKETFEQIIFLLQLSLFFWPCLQNSWEHWGCWISFLIFFLVFFKQLQSLWWRKRITLVFWTF